MIAERQESTWPFLCILACLFVLSATAPRAWERIARHETCAEMLQTESRRTTADKANGGDAETAVLERVPRTIQTADHSLANHDEDGGASTSAPTTVARRFSDVRSAADVGGPVLVNRLPGVASDRSNDGAPVRLPEVLGEPEIACPRTVEPTPPLRGAPPSLPELDDDESWQAEPAIDRLVSRIATERPETFERPLLPELSPRRTTMDTPEIGGESDLAKRPAVGDQFRQPIDDYGQSIDGEPVQKARSTTATEQAAETHIDEADQLDETLPDWRMSKRLLEQLKMLEAEPELRDWVVQLRAQLDELGSVVTQSASDTAATLERIEALHSQVEPLAQSLGDGPAATELRRAGYSLRRRLDLWQIVLPELTREDAALVQAAQDTEPLSMALVEVDQLTRNSAGGEAWRQYLLLESLQEATQSDEPRQRQQLAKQIVRRLARARLDQRQRRFVTTGPLAKLRTELVRWAAEPADPAEVLQTIERYEITGSNRHARQIAEARLWLGLSPVDEHKRLSQVVEAHYRNANFRLAVTEQLLNRLIPEREPEQQVVRDFVLGTPVYGHSTAHTDVAFRVVPDSHRLLLALEVTGAIDADTQSTSGPATFYNHSQSIYTARKLVEVGPWGMRLQPAQVRANNTTQLRGLRTGLDAIPILGMVVQDVARSHHEQRRHMIRDEIERKIAAKAKRRIDDEADKRLGRLSERLQDRVLEPLEEMELDPTLVSARTTDQRIIMRLRLAGQTQLGGHTPRPRARSDSLASLQIHESALNNMLQRLDLDGKTFTLAQLQKRIADRLERPDMFDPEEAREDVEITFAPEDAVRVSCDDGQFEIRLTILRLKAGARSWHGFEVRARYVPRVDGLEVKLHREEIVRLRGLRLSTASQIALRGIFTKTFSKDRPWSLMPERLLNNPNLSDLKVSQLVIDDGWIGVSLGHQNAPPMPAMARR